MREFVIPLAIGLAAGFAWFAIWNVALRAFGISLFARTPEERAARRERIVRMGKLQYTLLVGMLGYGLMFGLAVTIFSIGTHASAGWVRAAVRFVVYIVLFGWWYGVKTWNESFRGEVPFPPHFPPQT